LFRRVFECFADGARHFHPWLMESGPVVPLHRPSRLDADRP
jgi:hypothetical protein